MGVRESLLNTITSVADSDFVRIVTSAGASSKATLQNVIKSFETGLGAKSSLTTSDYVRVVGSDNNSYKQSLSDIANAVGEFNTTVQLLTDCNDAVDPSKIYYANGSTANRPENANWWFIKCEAKYENMIFQNAYFMNSTNVIVYQRSRDTYGNWGAWVKQPTRAEFTITSVSGISVTSAVSASNLRYSRYGNVIAVSGWLKCSTDPSANAVLFTLPRSVYEIQLTAYDQNSPNTVPAFTLRSNGNVEYYQGSIAGHVVNFGFTYITPNN